MHKELEILENELPKHGIKFPSVTVFNQELVS